MCDMIPQSCDREWYFVGADDIIRATNTLTGNRLLQSRTALARCRGPYSTFALMVLFCPSTFRPHAVGEATHHGVDISPAPMKTNKNDIGVQDNTYPVDEYVVREHQQQRLHLSLPHLCIPHTSHSSDKSCTAISSHPLFSGSAFLQLQPFHHASPLHRQPTQL